MPYLLIAAATVAVILANAVLGSMPAYRVAPAFLVPLLLVVYVLRKPLHLTPGRYALFASAVLLHDLGAYGFYQKSPTPPVSFDMYVHFYFAFVGTLILSGALSEHVRWKPWQLALATVLFIMGLGAIHEVMEFCTYLVLGEERGMLKPSASYRFDNERDLTCNLAGCAVALVAKGIYGFVRGARMSKQP